MPLTLLAPVSLAHVAEQLTRQGLRAPGLEALLATAHTEVRNETLDGLLGAALGIRGAALMPAAVFRLATEAGFIHDRDAYWLCADPVSTTLLIDNALVGGWVTDLSRTDADALIDAFNAEFADTGLRFIAPDPSRWYVCCPGDQQIQTTPLWRAAGNSMRDALPAGADGPQWRARLNAAQMLLHAHPVNDSREAAGQARIGSLWWWGQGRWPEFGAAQVDRVIGGPRWIQAACAATGVAHDARASSDGGAPDLSWLSIDAAERVLCIASGDWQMSATAADRLLEWDVKWFAPLSAALDAGQLAAATIHFMWADSTLTLACQAPQRSSWQRWLGLRPKRGEPRSIAVALEGLQR
ncbi:MAG: hypothetical protein ABI831_26850 [Betaproteobacteria bacterium]